MRKLLLTLLTGGDEDKPREFCGDLVRVGRAEWNDLVLDDPGHERVSRNHLEIVRRDRSFVLTDCGSRTGTFVNGTRVETAALKNGDVIRLGSGGPQLLVEIPSSDLRATVVVPALPETAPPDRPLDVRDMQRAENAVSEARPDPAPLPSVRRPSSAAPLPLEPAALASMEARLRHLTVIAGVACVILVVISLFVLGRLASLASRLDAQSDRLNRMDAVNAELVQKMSAVDLGALEKMFQEKAAQLDRRAREMEQKYQALFDRKARQIDQELNVMAEHPLLRGRIQELRRRRQP